MSSHPLVSICLPTYNAEAYLEVSLESVLAQTYENFEVIVVDDASTDTTCEILRKYADQDPRVKVTHNKKRKGLFENYNAALELAQGQFIKPFAQDDLLHPQFLEKTLAAFEANPSVVLVSTERGLIDGLGQTIRAVDVPKGSSIFPDQKSVPGFEVMRNCLFPVINYIGEPVCVMFKSQALGASFDAGFFHLGDIEYWLRILQEGDFLYFHQELALFRCHGASSTAANAKALMNGADLMRMGRKFAFIINELGRSEKEFISESLEAFSSYVRILSQSSPDMLDYIRDRQGLDEFFHSKHGLKNDNTEAALNLAFEYRELAYHALNMLAGSVQSVDWTHKTYRAFHENAETINELEAKLRTLLESKSWMMTRPLREIKSMVASDSLSCGKEFHLDMNGDFLLQQQEYIQYLERLCKGIKQSRSWKVAAPIRMLEKI